MSDAPERIWAENLNGNYSHLANCSFTDPKLDPRDHRVMDEYVLKDIAEKEKLEAVDKVENIAIDEMFRQINHILQPIRDMKNKLCPTVKVKWDWEDLYRELTEAITETLERADK